MLIFGVAVGGCVVRCVRMAWPGMEVERSGARWNGPQMMGHVGAVCTIPIYAGCSCCSTEFCRK